MQRPDGKHAVTIVLSQAENERLRLVMEHLDRHTATDCIRALINETAKKILPDSFRTQNNPSAPARRRAE